MRVHRSQAGFTLPELLVAMTAGMVVLMAAFMLLDRAVSSNTRISDRADAAQRGRLAMEVLTRDVRSQVCLRDGRPITAADENGLTFNANLTSNTDFADRRRIRYDPTTKTLAQDVFAGSGTFPDYTFSGTPTTTKTLIRPVALAKDGTVDRPMFRYYRFQAGGTLGQLEQLPVPLSAADTPDVVMVKVAFQSLPARVTERATDVREATTFESDIYVRLADPTRPEEGPRCA